MVCAVCRGLSYQPITAKKKIPTFNGYVFTCAGNVFDNWCTDLSVISNYFIISARLLTDISIAFHLNIITTLARCRLIQFLFLIFLNINAK